MKKLLLLLLIITSSNAIAQYGWTKGTLYLENGKTLSGLISLPMLSKDVIPLNFNFKVEYKPFKKGKKKRFKRKNVEKVIFSDPKIGTYVRVRVSKKQEQFFKVEVIGKVSLYSRSVEVTAPSTSGLSGIQHGGLSIDSNEYYVKRKHEQIASPLVTARISKSFRFRAKNYFSDKKEIVKKIENKIYKEEDIVQLVKDYNAL